MASFIVYGDASGQVTVAAPAVAGSNTITFPAETGTLITSAYTGTALPGQIAWNTTVQTTGFTAVAYGGYFCNTTSAAFTVTLPATPTRGQFVVIVDYAGTAATNNITVSGNGNPISGVSQNATIATNRSGLTLTYIDSTQGWVSTSNVYKSGSPYTQPIVVSYLVVAGGGAAGSTNSNDTGAGGGGAGGYLTGTATLTASTVYTATVGGGGAGTTGNTGGSNGSDSSLIGGVVSVTSTGGGRGGRFSFAAQGNGGSGGGGSYNQPGGSGTPGQGNAGGTGSTATAQGAGGGGGASAVGAPGTPAGGGNGGNGTASSITGSSVTYAGGGGGSSKPGSTAGTGGTGGGGNATTSGSGTSGTANTGGGGGGNEGGTAGSGGSGVVIISIPTAQYTGTITGSPTVTTSGSNTIIKWTTGSGTYTA